MTNEIVLKSIELENFMGIRKKHITFDPLVNYLLGKNATGKTTVNTAFRWILFNKDVKDRKDFEIKTLGRNGLRILGLDHRVTAWIDLSGQEVILTKIYKEIWRKKKGAEEARFSGHETLYYIDEVPCLKKEYDSWLETLMSENTFKIVTDPLYFSTQLHWTDQRKIIMDVTGDIPDEEVIAANNTLEKLDLEGKTIENYRKMVKEKRKNLNEDLEKIPTRIDEVEKGKRHENFDEINSELLECQRELNELNDFWTDETAEDPARKQLVEKIRLIKTSIQTMDNDGKLFFDKSVRELKGKIGSLTEDSQQQRMKAANKRQAVKEAAEENQRYEQKLIDLRRKWTEKDEQGFSGDIETVCPTCNQDLPEEDLHNKIEEMKAKFNQEKAERLEELSSIGKEVAAKKEKNENYIMEESARMNDWEAEANNLLKEAEELNKKLDQLQYQEPKEIEELREQQAIWEDELEGMKDQDKEAEKAAAMERKAQLEKEVDTLKGVLIYKDTNANAEKRIVELKAEAKKLSQLIANIEKQEYLSDEFIKVKVGMLEGMINEKFENVTFRLFETQVNGAVDEVCKALVNGVPFADANRAGQVNAGIDIINTLTEFYQVTAPIFIDNRESITDIIKTDSQVINLNVEDLFDTLIINPTAEDYAAAQEKQKKNEAPNQTESLFD